MRLHNLNPLLLLTIHQISPTSASAVLSAREEPTIVTKTLAPSTPSSAPEFVSDTAFKSAILNRTNFFRAEHDAPSVSYNDTLANFASDYLSSKKCEFEHSGGPYGENLAIGCSDVTGCVNMWGNERDEYNFGHPGFEKKTGHFTQLVWKNTTDVGCGRRLCGKGWFLVCEYWPRGNIIGAFGEMVRPEVNEGVGRTEGGLGGMVGKMVGFWMGLFILLG